MVFDIHKCNWCSHWENGCQSKKILNPYLPSHSKSSEELNNYFKVLMKSKRKVKLLLESLEKTKVVQGTICTVTDDSIFVLENKHSVPTAISMSIIKHVIPL